MGLTLPPAAKFKTRAVFFFFMSLFLLPPAGAVAQDAGGVITGVEITGLRRTREHVVLYSLEKFVGRQAADLDFVEVRHAILDTGVLDTVSEELVPDGSGGYILAVTVWEMWSVFPAPIFFMSGPEYFTFGLFFLDTNAFGLRHMMAVGGMYGSAVWMGVAIYRFTPVRSDRPSWTAFFMYRDAEERHLDRYENTRRRYDSNVIRSSFGIEQPLAGGLSVSFNTGVNHVSLAQTGSSFNQPDGGATHLHFSPGVSLSSSSRDGFFVSEQGVSLEYRFNAALVGTSFHELGFQGVFERPVTRGLRWNIQSGAIWRSGGGPLAEGGPQDAAVHVLPGRFSALSYAGLSAGAERVITQFSWGMVTALGSMQAVFSHGPVSGSQFDWGPAVEGRLYLTRVALPAVGLNMAYNINSGRFHLAVTVGMAF